MIIAIEFSLLDYLTLVINCKFFSLYIMCCVNIKTRVSGRVEAI